MPRCMDGMVVHCEMGEETGREIIYQLVLQQQGRFEFTPGAAPSQMTLSDNVESLLLEAARRMDEQERSQYEE